MTMLALDWNATRVRAVVGPAGQTPVPVLLEPPGLDLPLVISLANSVPEIGVTAARQSRRSSHLMCQMFLPHVAEANQGPRWQVGRHSLGARDACVIVWRRLHSLGVNAHGIVITVPSYLTLSQADSLRRLAGRLPVLGSTPNLLIAALAGHNERYWDRSVLVVDVDDHALTLGWIKAMGDKAHLIDSRSFTNLGTRFWKERLLNVLSDLCVLHHRRDPRDVPDAEQNLYDELDPLIDAALKRQAIQLSVQGAQWSKHLLVHPEQPAQFCEMLAHQAASEAEHLLACWPVSELPRSILLTHEASRLPGLREAMQALVMPSATAETRLPRGETNFHDDDFGEAMMFPENESVGQVHTLTAEAPVRTTHALSALFVDGTLSRGHVDTIMPLARRQSSAVKSNS